MGVAFATHGGVYVKGRRPSDFDRSAARAGATGIRAYDGTRWGGPAPVASHVVAQRDGVSLLLQHGDGVEDGMTIEAAPAPVARLLVRRGLAPQVRADIGGARFAGAQPRGAYVLIPAGAPARFVTTAATFDMTIQAHLDPCLIRAACDAAGGDEACWTAPAFGAADPLVLRAAEALLGEAARPEICSVRWRAAAEALTLRLASPRAARPQPGRGGLAPWQLRRVRDLMLGALDQPLTLAQLAAAARLSPFHFCRAFRDTTGETPFAHLARLRLERAMRLAAETDRPLLEIALEVGYETESGLARLFRRSLGVGPAAYRGQRRR